MTRRAKNSYTGVRPWHLPERLHPTNWTAYEMCRTIIALTVDHGDMLGNHGLFAKSVFHEESTKVPFIIVPTQTTPSLDIMRLMTVWSNCAT